MTNIMSLTQRIMNNESPNNGNNTDKELGNFNDVMTWLDVHNDTRHPHALLHYAWKKHGDRFLQSKSLFQ